MRRSQLAKITHILLNSKFITHNFLNTIENLSSVLKELQLYCCLRSTVRGNYTTKQYILLASHHKPAASRGTTRLENDGIMGEHRYGSISLQRSCLSRVTMHYRPPPSRGARDSAWSDFHVVL